MHIKQAVEAIRPLQGEVIPIRTVQETRPPEEFGMSLTRHSSHATNG
jgi:tRNA-specific adenosine deaminase 3